MTLLPHCQRTPASLAMLADLAITTIDRRLDMRRIWLPVLLNKVIWTNRHRCGASGEQHDQGKQTYETKIHYVAKIMLCQASEQGNKRLGGNFQELCLCVQADDLHPRPMHALNQDPFNVRRLRRTGRPNDGGIIA